MEEKINVNNADWFLLKVFFYSSKKNSNEKKKIGHYIIFGIAPHFKNFLLQDILNLSYFTAMFEELLNKTF